MFKAVDKDENIITISDARSHNNLFCRCCNSPVYYVPGNTSVKYGKSPHFRHFPKRKCIDNWNHDKTQWHRDWQNCFPIDSQEVIFEKDGKKHITDVALSESGVVIEFQHSYISPSEFKDRNDFYTALGYRVIWVFDIQKSYSRRKIGINERGYDALIEAYYWDSPLDCLREYRLNSSVDVFLQITDSETDTKMLRLSRSDVGFKLLYAPSFFSKEDFIRFAYSPDELRKYRCHHSKEEFEKFGELKFKGMDCSKRTIVLGCPLTSSGSETSIEDCRHCQFHELENKETIGCLKQYLSMPIAEEINASEAHRDALEQIKGIRLTAIPNEKFFTVNSPKGKSLEELWDDYSSAGIMILLNLNSGSRIKICRSWFLEGKNSNKYECEIRMKGHRHFMKDRKLVIYPEKKQFAVLWWDTPSQS